MIYKDAYEAICEIARVYDDYHYDDNEVMDKIGDILKEYGFID